MMPTEIDLLRSLDDEPRGPSTVDVRRAIVVARRRRRARRAVGYAGAAAVTALAVAGASIAAGRIGAAPPTPGATHTTTAPAPRKAEYTIPGDPKWRAAAATPPTGCTLDRLAVPGNAPMALVSGADPAGRYIVGRSYPKSGGYQAVIWHDGKDKKVALPGDLEESLTDVNTTGTAVGWSYDKAGPIPYAYHDGKVTKLAGAAHGSAKAINDAGAIVGDDGHNALLWKSLSAKAIRLPVPAGTTTVMVGGIDEDGTTVGTIDHDRPYVWFPDGTHRELPIPDIGGKPEAAARAIRNGWVSGVITKDLSGADKDRDGKGNVQREVQMVRWNLRTGPPIVTGIPTFAAPTVNAQGWQIGTDHRGWAILYTGGSVVTLPGLKPFTPDGMSTIPDTLSDDARIVAGQSDDASGTIQAVIWHCK
jgi:uncharacterized membrane protein